jgi:exodeoxyribonuclease VII large subunit
MNDVVLGVSDFVALVNQTFAYAYDSVVIVGELANFKISKNKWVYFDLKDELASVRFFGTVYALPGPLEDGMLLEVRGNPRLHPQFGFSITAQSMRPVGEGSIKKAANLLEASLRAEGLFDDERKRPLPYPPRTVGLITSQESAAYADFMKILDARWRGLEVQLIDVQVQGSAALDQILGAIKTFNQMAAPPEVLVLIRGGGSADDLQVFSSEQVTRAVAASRIPVLVAIGHEVDNSLVELAADLRASTPSNAAELLVPDRREVRKSLLEQAKNLTVLMDHVFAAARTAHREDVTRLGRIMDDKLETLRRHIERQKQLAAALSPAAALRRGYAIVRSEKSTNVRSGSQLSAHTNVTVQLFDAIFSAEVNNITMK